METAKNELQEYYQKKGLPLPIYFTVVASPQPNLTWKSTVSIISLDSLEESSNIREHFSGRSFKSKIQSELSAAKKALEKIRSYKETSRPQDSLTKKEPFKKTLEKIPGMSKNIPKSPSPIFYNQNHTIGDRYVQNQAIKDTHPLSENKNIIEVEKISDDTEDGFDFETYSSKSRDANASVMLKKDTVLLVDVENIPKIIQSVLGKYIDFPENLWIYAFVGKHHSQSAVISSIKHPRVSKILSPSTRKDGTDTCMQIYVGMFLYDETFEEYMVCTRDHFGDTLVEFIESNEQDQPWKSKKATLVTCIEHIEKTITRIGFVHTNTFKNF